MVQMKYSRDYHLGGMYYQEAWLNEELPCGCSDLPEMKRQCCTRHKISDCGGIDSALKRDQQA